MVGIATPGNYLLEKVDRLIDRLTPSTWCRRGIRERMAYLRVARGTSLKVSLSLSPIWGEANQNVLDADFSNSTYGYALNPPQTHGYLTEFRGHNYFGPTRGSTAAGYR